MKHLVEEFKQLHQKEQLFDFWQQELRIRQQLRTSSFSVPPIDSEETLALLKRALYYPGYKDRFYEIIFHNLNNISIIKSLFQTAPGWGDNFLSFLPFYIYHHPIKPQDLSFLVNVYQEKYQNYYTRIINILDHETIHYLANRTANPGLKQLFTQRLEVLEHEKRNIHYGLLEHQEPLASLPTIWGDKAHLMIDALEQWQKSSPEHFRDPFGFERFKVLLAFAQSLFCSGLVEDTLAALLNIYEDYLGQSRILDLEADASLYRSLEKMLRSTVPLFSLLQSTRKPFELSQNLYQDLFSRFVPDRASLEYLTLYEITKNPEYRSRNKARYFLLYWADRMRELRKSDSFPVCLQEMMQNPGEISMLGAIDAAGERLNSLPHESFAILEGVRFLIKMKVLRLTDARIRDHGQKHYLDLWHWIPHPLFVNRDIFLSWELNRDNKTRHQWEQIIHAQEATSLTMPKSGPRKLSVSIHMEVLLARLSGVMPV